MHPGLISKKPDVDKDSHVEDERRSTQSSSLHTAVSIFPRRKQHNVKLLTCRPQAAIRYTLRSGCAYKMRHKNKENQ